MSISRLQNDQENERRWAEEQELAKLRAENERLRRFVRSLADSPATALDGHMVVAAAATVLGSESEGDPR